MSVLFYSEKRCSARVLHVEKPLTFQKGALVMSPSLFLFLHGLAAHTIAPFQTLSDKISDSSLADAMTPLYHNIAIQTSWLPVWQNIATCVSACDLARGYYKRANGGGSPVIHRLEDNNRQMMNDEDEWHSILPNVAQNKWIPRALLIISMSFQPLCFSINHVNLLIFKFIHS